MLTSSNSTVLLFFYMTNNTDIWLHVHANTKLLAAVANADVSEVTQMQSLRKQWSVDEIAVASALLEARTRAQKKLINADILLADSVGVQQATSSAIALHKAKRFNTNTQVFDFCCGIGADLQELPSNTIGVDVDPLRCFMAAHNTSKEVRCNDILHMTIPSNALIHIDPARRSGAQRLHGLDAMQPSIDELRDIITSCAGGCIKVSPSVNAEDVEDFPVPYELEYIEENGRVLQCALWFGSLALHAGNATATSISMGISISGVPDFPSFSKSIEGLILVPNPALERSGLHCNLAEELGAKELSPNLGLFCSEYTIDSAWFKQFEILASTSLRIEKVQKVLREYNCTQVEVKTRGKTIDPNEWQNKLSSNSSGDLLTIFALRLGKKRVAIITRRRV